MASFFRLHTLLYRLFQRTVPGCVHSCCNQDVLASMQQRQCFDSLANSYSMRSQPIRLAPDPHPLRHVAPLLYNEAFKMPEGATMSNLDNALRELREKRSQAQIEIEKL